VTADPGVSKTWLGRPWRPYARVVFINTQLPGEVVPQGWNNWGSAANEHTAWYGEYHSTGPGARPSDRVPWAHTLTADEAARFQPGVFLAGADHWDASAEAARLP
ncbi:MAG: pectinesterase family protein, partial [Acidobacteriaceae bacterium]